MFTPAELASSAKVGQGFIGLNFDISPADINSVDTQRIFLPSDDNFELFLLCQ